jgi:hypothetical protein
MIWSLYDHLQIYTRYITDLQLPHLAAEHSLVRFVNTRSLCAVTILYEAFCAKVAQTLSSDRWTAHGSQLHLRIAAL